MLLDKIKINKSKLGDFRFKEFPSDFLITNDSGAYSFLDPVSFKVFLSGRLEGSSPNKYLELKEKGFIRDKLDLDSLSQKYYGRNSFLGHGAALHIVVVTLRCDHCCVYCQAYAGALSDNRLDMDIKTAQKTVDFIFDSPNKNITIEFQGGEPLANFKIIDFIVEYSKKKNRQFKKNLIFAITSNLSFMNNQIKDFIFKNKISLCTSLDGPAKVHNAYRLKLSGTNSYRNTIKWIRDLKKEYTQRQPGHEFAVLTTVTKFSFRFYKEIIDDFIRLDLKSIHLRPLSPVASNRKSWNGIFYTAEEFLDFYLKSMDYILDLNSKGIVFQERFAKIFLNKILFDTDSHYMDIRSPCGAGIGQIAYNFNGDIYTCDEGRMMSRIGDESFKIGNVNQDNYRDVNRSDVLKAVCIASCLEALPGCAECVYKSYCGVCPVYNHKINGNIFFKTDFTCKIHSGILDYLFFKLKDEKFKRILYGWVNKN